MLKTITFALILIVAFHSSTKAQNQEQKPDWNSLETSINNKKFLLITEHQLQVIKQQALESGSDITLARCLYNLMRIRDQRTEDTLYFKNSAFLDTLLAKPASPRLMAILHLMRAQRISRFDAIWYKFNFAAYRTKNVMVDYGAYDAPKRDSVVNADFQSALDYHGIIGDFADLSWLSSNPEVFLFKAGFADIVYAEHISFMLQRPAKFPRPSLQLRTWLSLSSTAFRQKLDSLSASRSASEDPYVGYRNWLTFHQKEPGTIAFIESLLRKNIYLAASRDSLAEKAYISYLTMGTNSPYAAFKAHSVYELCLFYNGEGTKYGNFRNIFGYSAARNFNPKYQDLPAKALDLFEKERQNLRQYPVFYQVLSAMEMQIRSVGLRIEIADTHLSDKPIPMTLTYKNTQRLYYRVVRVPAGSLPKTGKVVPESELLKRVQSEQGEFALPLPPDHNRHAVYLKLGPLPSGRYQLLFSSSKIETSIDSIQTLPFNVTNIAVIHGDKRMFVLDRNTGFPLTGAEVVIFKSKTNPMKLSSSSTASGGYVDIIEADADSVCVSYKGDTTGYHFSIPRQELKNYKDNIRASVFTDRSIYRPGQTVQYKVIFLTRDSKSGVSMLYNFQHGASRPLKLKDPAYRTVDSAKIQVNDFGSLSGSFVLPKVAKPGYWRIDAGGEVDYGNYGSFRVEEYKRPTIELSMVKQSKMLLPGKAFVIKLKLRALNGAQLGNTQVHYTLTRSGTLPSARKVSEDIYPKLSRVQLLERTGQTDVNGELLIPVLDSLLSKEQFTEDEAWFYNYQLTASAVAGTSEKSLISESIAVTSRPVNIDIPMKEVYDRQALPRLPISLRTEFEGTINMPVHVKIYRVHEPDLGDDINKHVDLWYYAKADWNRWFPNSGISSDIATQRLLVLDTVINGGSGTLVGAGFGSQILLDKSRFAAGFYKINAGCTVEGKTLGTSDYDFRIFDSKAKEAPLADVSYFPKSSARPGEMLTWYSSGKTADYTIYQVLYVNNKRKLINIYLPSMERSGMRQWQYRVPTDASGRLSINRIQVNANKIGNYFQSVEVIRPVPESIEIVMERYSKVMAPAAVETFSLSLKTKNARIAGEMMTTLYDASLDKLEKHNWNLPYTETPTDNIFVNWDRDLFTTREFGYNLIEPLIQQRNFGLLQQRYMDLSDSQTLNEVVTVGYGTNLRFSPVASTHIMIRGTNNLQGFKKTLVILDGEVFAGDLSSINAATIRDAVSMNGADAVALYGSRAQSGVLILSTKGPISLPVETAPVVKIRKNFQETAFFFPQMHIDKDDYYRFSFSMPDAATEWNWKILAHTRTAQFAYAERKLQTQLNLMVQPNMPRLLYQGDKIKLQSRVSNLDSIPISGTATCKIEDAVTGEDLTALLTKSATQSFNIDKKSNAQVSFLLQVPPEQTNPLKIVIAATSGQVSDAEEHLIPILSSKVFVRQSQPLNFNGQASLRVNCIPLQSTATLYGLGLSVAQKPEAAIFNALPWLANYSYDSAEQTFNKLRAEVTALNLVQKDSAIRNNARVSGTKDSSQEDEANVEAMPWLRLNNHAKVQQKALLSLLDTTATKLSMSKHLERLNALQQPDGGLSWFDGGKSNPYISAYILAGFGQLHAQSWLPEPLQSSAYNAFILQLLKYQQTQLTKQTVDSYSLYTLYATSYWNRSKNMPAASNASVQSVLTYHWAIVDKLPLDQQAMLIICSLGYGSNNNPFLKKAMQQLQNIREASIEDNQNGLRWKAISDTEELNNSAEETMALIAEAFRLSGKYKEVEPGMVKWLLSAKQDEHWSTTKGTAAAISMLENTRPTAFTAVNTIQASAGGKQLSVSNDLLKGGPYAFTRLKDVPATIQLESEGKGVNGSLSWYYFADPDGLDTLNRKVQIRKVFYLLQADKSWVLFKPGTVLKAGDQVRVRLTVETASRLKFVQLSDPRAAAFEPGESKSGYEYGNGFSYYRSIRDTGLGLFFEQLPRGISEISYELIVAHSGEFKAGPATLSCMYQPAINAYSSTQIIKVN